MTFHGSPRMDQQAKENLHESPWVVTVPLIILVIPAIGAGWLIEPMLFGGYFGESIHIETRHEAVSKMDAQFQWCLENDNSCIYNNAILAFVR